jgi:hypothetical protein
VTEIGQVGRSLGSIPPRARWAGFRPVATGGPLSAARASTWDSPRDDPGGGRTKCRLATNFYISTPGTLDGLRVALGRSGPPRTDVKAPLGELASIQTAPANP